MERSRSRTTPIAAIVLSSHGVLPVSGADEIVGFLVWSLYKH